MKHFCLWIFIDLFTYFTKKHIPLPMKTDKNIQRKYKFSVMIDFDKEFSFGHTKCAKTLKSNIAWLQNN